MCPDPPGAGGPDMAGVQPGHPRPEFPQRDLGRLGDVRDRLAVRRAVGGGRGRGVRQGRKRVDRVLRRADGEVVHAELVDALLEEAADPWRGAGEPHLAEPVQRREKGRLPGEHHGGWRAAHGEDRVEFTQGPQRHGAVRPGCGPVRPAGRLKQATGHQAAQCGGKHRAAGVLG